jgi:aspartate aminotransferase
LSTVRHFPDHGRTRLRHPGKHQTGDHQSHPGWQDEIHPVDGIPELKAAICAKLDRDNDLSYTPSQINVSPGGKPVIYNALIATLSLGDEVIIPAPYWVSYPDIVYLAGGEPAFVKTNADNNFKVQPADLEAAITPRTRCLLLNSPSNPSGAAYNPAELRKLRA